MRGREEWRDESRGMTLGVSNKGVEREGERNRGEERRGKEGEGRNER